MSKQLAPKDVRTNDEVIRLRTDNYSTPSFWIIVNGEEVTIAQQADGEECKVMVSIPRVEFNRLISWYTRLQNLRPKP